MITEIFTICDFAQDAGNGKLTIVGTFDNVNSPVFPCMHPQCALAVRMRFSNKENGAHTANIKFKNAKGEIVLPEIKCDLNVPATAQDYTTTNMVFNFSNLPIKEPGKIVIELYVDDEWQSGLTLNSNKVQIAA